MRLFYLLISVWLCAISCTPATTGVPTPKLILEQDGLRLTISPGHVPVETALTLTLHAEGLISVTGELTGATMYMGTVPLRFSKMAENQWQAEFFLGACSDPAMQWQLLLQLHYPQDSTRTVSQLLQSSWR
ncbi:MAG: hypothetical protein KKE94_16245 [Gammaproteobacteria bacterium]|uniref:hypothetical protein n=1 Tax=Rheinheimera sp. TaxID=1869214 RepID=UPI0040484358|nr:hypothetical protein [Gammaproteobacteria bacterium]